MAYNNLCMIKSVENAIHLENHEYKAVNWWIIKLISEHRLMDETYLTVELLKNIKLKKIDPIILQKDFVTFPFALIKTICFKNLSHNWF